MKRAVLFALVVGSSPLLVGSTCDPVHSNAVDALGPEPDPNVGAGPQHRPGQPCLVCHGGSGPAGRQEFSVGGTVFHSPDDPTPAENVIVHLTDANGAEKFFQTNSAGNFYAFTSSWNPTYPVHVELNPGDTSVAMRTHVGRDGSCAGCHKPSPGPDSPGRVYLTPPNAAGDAGTRRGSDAGQKGDGG